MLDATGSDGLMVRMVVGYIQKGMCKKESENPTPKWTETLRGLGGPRLTVRLLL